MLAGWWCVARLRSKVQPGVQLGPPVPFHSGFGAVGTSGTCLKPSVRLSARSQLKPALRLVRSWAIRVISVILPGFCWPLGFSDVISQMFAVPLLCLIWISCNWSVEILAAEEDMEEGPEEIHLCRNECAPFRPAWAVQMFYSSFSSPLWRFKQYQNTETPF